MRKNSSAYTIIEILITLIIACSLLALGVFTLQTYLPKQRLLDSMETVEQVLNRAQFEATSRSTWSCISYDNTTKKFTIHMDANSNHNAGASACGDSPDLLITTQQIKDEVSLASCTNVTSSFDFTSPLWFDSAGIPKDCGAGTCVPVSVQIFVTNPKLPSSNRAREIEAVASGLISIAERNDPGYITSLFAKTATQTGSGECE